MEAFFIPTSWFIILWYVPRKLTFKPSLLPVCVHFTEYLHHFPTQFNFFISSCAEFLVFHAKNSRSYAISPHVLSSLLSIYIVLQLLTIDFNSSPNN